MSASAPWEIKCALNAGSRRWAQSAPDPVSLSDVQARHHEFENHFMF